MSGFARHIQGVGSRDLTRGISYEKLWRTLGCAVLLWFGATVTVGGVTVPIEIFGLLALIPMFLYDGRKLTRYIK